jgi:dTDP-4-dehydrorhamnose 3,5-epimerase-like enzyme
MDFEVVDMHADTRGVVFEPVGVEELAIAKNVHVVISKPGAIRANHYHNNTSEVMVVTGPTLARFRCDGVISDVEIPVGEAYRFRIDAGVSHAIKNIGDVDTMLIAFASQLHNRTSPDVEMDKLI